MFYNSLHDMFQADLAFGIGFFFSTARVSVVGSKDDPFFTMGRYCLPDKDSPSLTCEGTYPAFNYPLSLLDPRIVDERDWVTYEMVYPDRLGSRLFLSNRSASSHKWY